MLFGRGIQISQTMPPPLVIDVCSFSLPARRFPEEVFQVADGQGRGDDQGGDDEEKTFSGLVHAFLNPPVRLVVMKRMYSPFFSGWAGCTSPYWLGRWFTGNSMLVVTVESSSLQARACRSRSWHTRVRTSSRIFTPYLFPLPTGAHHPKERRATFLVDAGVAHNRSNRGTGGVLGLGRSMVAPAACMR